VRSRTALWIALGVLAVLATEIHREQRNLASVQGQIEALRRERDALREGFDARAGQHDPLGIARAPAAGIVVGIPTVLQEEVLTKAVTEVLSVVRIRLRNLDVHHEEDVTARFLFVDRSIAHMDIDLHLPELVGTVHPGIPTFTFGSNKIGVDVPVSIVEGRGQGSLRFQWGAKGISDLLCGSADITKEVGGRIRPGQYRLRGALALAAEGDDIVATPQFGAFVMRLQIDPSRETWAMVDDVFRNVIATHNPICGLALKKVDVPQRIREIVDQGFEVRFPDDFSRPIRFPVAVEQAVDINGKTVNLAAHPIALTLTSTTLWFGADVGAAPSPPPAPARVK
jgi:hypothetical protein